MLVTLRQMQYVIAVADTGSFSKAANICAADQSTVSQQVRLFEDRLGITIFNRDTLPVKVTAQGIEVVHQCRDIVNKVDAMVKPFKEVRVKFA